jgi:transposase
MSDTDGVAHVSAIFSEPIVSAQLGIEHAGTSATTARRAFPCVRAILLPRNVQYRAKYMLILHRQASESMAPHLATSQHHLIRDMILDGTLTAAQMATAASCSKRSVKAIRSNLRHFHATKAPANGGGRRRSITPPMLDALRERLLEKPGLYLEEMTLFLWDKFDVLVSTHSISRTLRAVGWSKKVARQIAREQNAELRDFYLYNLTQF